MKPLSPPKQVVHRLLGFDVREQWLRFDAIWTKERIQQYLIKNAVTKPLSADEAVWPTIIEVADSFPLSICDNQFNVIEPPDWTGINTPLWESVEHLMDYVTKECNIPCEMYCIIAITKLTCANESSNDEWPHLGRIVPHDVGWSFIGFDVVASQSMFSGLMNCAYSNEERCEAMLRWGDRLNEHHLFSELEHAQSFKEWTDVRVPEHAPFNIFGLFRTGAGWPSLLQAGCEAQET